MKKIHILLVENKDNEIEFFTEALEESGLSFLCNTARNVDEALKILKRTVPDIVFVDSSMAKGEEINVIKKTNRHQHVPLIFYSTISTNKSTAQCSASNYVQLPRSINTMARILKNLFLGDEIQPEPVSYAK